MDTNKEKSDMGILTVQKYLINSGFVVKDVSHAKGHNGYDILATKDKQSIKIEVKCSTKERGIPDCFGSEFNDDMKVNAADFFYIVRLNDDKKPLRIEVLSKKDINKYSSFHHQKRMIKIASKLKTDLKKGKIGKIIELR